jgi:hypothetical protein
VLALIDLAPYGLAVVRWAALAGIADVAVILDVEVKDQLTQQRACCSIGMEGYAGSIFLLPWSFTDEKYHGLSLFAFTPQADVLGLVG